MVARGERMIQAAILTYGAVGSVVEVFADFLSYQSGTAGRSDPPPPTPHGRGLRARGDLVREGPPDWKRPPDIIL